MLEPKNTSSQNLIVTILKLILNFVAAKWYHLFMIMVLLACSTATYALWYVKDDLRELVRTKIERPTMKLTRMDTLTPQLREQTGAVAVTVSKINVAADTRELAYSFTDSSTATSLSIGRRTTLFTGDDTRNDRNVIRIIHGEAFCDENDGFGLMPESNISTIKVICVIGLPPGYNSEFVGLLAVGFTGTPSNKQLVFSELNRAAEELLR